MVMAQWSKENSKLIFDKIRSYSSFPDLQVSICGGTTFQVKMASNEIVECAESTLFQIHLLVKSQEQWIGESWGDSFAESDLEQLVKKAEAVAKQSQKRWEIDPIKAVDTVTELPLWSDKTALLTWKERAELWKESVKYCQANRYALNGHWRDQQYYQTVINTKGIHYFQASTPCELQIQVNTTVNPGIGYQSQTAYDWTKIRPLPLTEKAAYKAQTSTNGRTPMVGEVEVLLEARAVKALLAQFLTHYHRPHGQVAHGWKRNVTTAVSLSSLLHISSDPLDKLFPFVPFTLSADRYTPITWIKNGVIQQLPTMAVPFHMQTGGFTNEQLIQRMNKGLVVSHVQALQVENQEGMVLTGVTTGGTFWVENGKVTMPSKNVRFQVDCVQLFSSIIALGVEEIIDQCRMGAILTSSFRLLSVSESY